MHRKTVTILLRIRARGHFVMSITKTHESHYVGVLYNPQKISPFWLVKSSAVFFRTVQKRVNSVQKQVTNQAFWLVKDQRNSQMANQIFCFQIKHTPWMAQLMGSCNFVSLWKIYSCLFIPNCTRNHVIAYTNVERECHVFQSQWIVTKYLPPCCMTR